MAHRGRKRGKSRKRSGEHVTIRVANSPTRHRGKRRKAAHHGKRKRRRNATNPKHHGGRRRRRRRNQGTFGDRLMTMLGAAAAGLAAGTIVTIGQAKLSPGNPITLYGLPAAAIVAAAALGKTAPTVAVGLGVGGVSMFVLPIASRLLGAGPLVTAGKPATTAQIAEAMAALGAVDISRAELDAVDMSGGEYYETVDAVDLAT